MQHVFEYFLKEKESGQVVHDYYVTQSSRYGKVAKRLLADINRLRKASGLPEYGEDDLEDFQIRKWR
jgi:hypothetical protein